MWKNLFSDTKMLTSAGAVVIALSLIWLINQRWQGTEEALRLNAKANESVSAAVGANTEVVKQFQSLLLEIERDSRLRASLQ